MALLASALLGGATLGANNRIVYFGSPPPGTGGGYNDDGSLIFGTLTNTPVTVGGRTATVLLVRNDGGQTLNHVKIAGGTTADGKPGNPLFPDPGGTSLPSGASFAAVLPQDGDTCNPNTSAGFECSVGTLAAGASASFIIVITPPSTVGTYNYWLTGSWNEGWSSTGTNADYNFATGVLNVTAGSCAGGTSNYFLAGEVVDLNDGSSTVCQNQDAKVKSGAALSGNGGFASFGIDSGFAVDCPDGFRCTGATVSASVLGGVPVPGGVEWTVTWFGTKTMGGVIHFFDSYSAENPDDFVAIPFTRKFKCSATLTTNCWVSTTTSKGNVKPAFITAVFITPDNGKGGGFL